MTNDIMVRETAKLLSWLRAWDEQTYQHSLRTAGTHSRLPARCIWRGRTAGIFWSSPHSMTSENGPSRKGSYESQEN